MCKWELTGVAEDWGWRGRYGEGERQAGGGAGGRGRRGRGGEAGRGEVSPPASAHGPAGAS